MIRQAAIAIGVALFVAIVGTPISLQERVAAYHRAWWIAAALSLLSIIRTELIIGTRRSSQPVHTSPHPVGDQYET
jgi:hypothetical protein